MKEHAKLQAAVSFSNLSLIMILLSARLPAMTSFEYEDHIGWVWLHIEFPGAVPCSQNRSFS